MTQRSQYASRYGRRGFASGLREQSLDDPGLCLAVRTSVLVGPRRQIALLVGVSAAGRLVTPKKISEQDPVLELRRRVRAEVDVLRPLVTNDLADHKVVIMEAPRKS